VQNVENGLPLEISRCDESREEFKRWLAQHTNNPEIQRQTSKEAISKGESIQLELK
jgi:hypothetical protein